MLISSRPRFRWAALGATVTITVECEVHMIRWMMLGLLLCNTIYFVWQHNSKEVVGASAAIQPSAANDARLTLVSEASSKNGGASSAKPATQPLTTNTAVSQPPAPICHMVGPFKEKISAHQVQDRLKALDIPVHTFQVNIPDKPDYWVHLGPMRSRKEALDILRELQAKKIDSFLITEGELLNGISLGFFTREELAQVVLKQRREQGYDAKIRAVPRFTQELWEVFSGDHAGKLSSEVLKKIIAGTQGVELRKNSCDLVASAEKLD